MFKFVKLELNLKCRNGSAFLLATFICAIAVMTVVSMSFLSSSNTKQIVYQTDGKAAYYAAEAGVADSIDFFNSSFLNWGISLDSTDLPIPGAETVLLNSAEYWISNLTYANDNKIAIVDVIGKYKGAYRKIRVRISSTIPKYFDDYGLLTDGILTIHGNKTLDMSIHANDGLSLKGPTTTEEGAVATQSIDPDASSPDPLTNPIGGYVEPIDVPLVPIDDLRTISQTGLNVDISAPDCNNQIINAPAGSAIYITNNYNSKNTLTLTGDMQSKVIFVDSNITVGTSGSSLSDVMVVSSGNLTVNGSVDFLSSHAGLIDTIFASEGSIILNGSRKFQTLFWTNDSFTQNGSSMAGRIIAQKGITFNGSFTLTASNKLFDYGTFDNIATLSSWQQVSMD